MAAHLDGQKRPVIYRLAPFALVILCGTIASAISMTIAPRAPVVAEVLSEINIISTPEPTPPTPTVEPARVLAPGPKTALTLFVRIGPGENYRIIGTAGRDTPLQVIGRDTTNAWVAVRINGGALTGWLPRRWVYSLENYESLPIAPITLLPNR